MVALSSDHSELVFQGPDSIPFPTSIKRILVLTLHLVGFWQRGRQMHSLSLNPCVICVHHMDILTALYGQDKEPL